MNWDKFAELNVRIDYATMAQMNSIRAWARKHKCRVEVQRYATNAYEGHIVVPLHGRHDQQQALCIEARAAIQAAKGGAA